MPDLGRQQQRGYRPSDAAADHIDQGLICVLTAVEPWWSFEIVRDHAGTRIEAEPRYRECLHLHHYRIHQRFDFMSARIQTWLPFRIQICQNGREWSIGCNPRRPVL